MLHAALGGASGAIINPRDAARGALSGAMGAVAAEVLVEAMIDKNALREHVFAQGFRDQRELDGLVRAHIRPVRDVAQVLATLAGGLMGSPHAAMTTSRVVLDNNTPQATAVGLTVLAQRLGLLTVGTAASVMLKDKLDEEGKAAKGDGGSKKSGDEPPKDPGDPKAPRAAAAAAAASSARPKPGERASPLRPQKSNIKNPQVGDRIDLGRFTLRKRDPTDKSPIPVRQDPHSKWYIQKDRGASSGSGSHSGDWKLYRLGKSDPVAVMNDKGFITRLYRR